MAQIERIRTFVFPSSDLSLETGIKRIAAKYGGKLLSQAFQFGDRELEIEFATVTNADMATIEIKRLIRKGNKKMATRKKKRVYGPIRQKKRGRPKGSKNKKKVGKKKAGKKKVGRKRKPGRPKGSKNKVRGVNALKVGKKGDSFLITIKKAG